MRFANDLTKIDVHGLHSEEAVYLVLQRLDFLRQFDVTELSIITGVGSHSIGRAVIQPALISALEENHYSYDNRIAGQILVRVKH